MLTRLPGPTGEPYRRPRVSLRAPFQADLRVCFCLYVFVGQRNIEKRTAYVIADVPAFYFKLCACMRMCVRAHALCLYERARLFASVR